MGNRQFLSLIIFLLFLAGCAVKKPETSSVEMGKALSRSEKKTLISDLQNSKITYSSFTGRAKTNLKINDNTFNTTLHLRIKHQEAIWISVTAIMGIEVARVLITPESIKIINRIQNEYIDKPFNYIYNFTGQELDFNAVEDLLIGNTMDLIFDDDLALFHTSNGYEAQGTTDDLKFSLQFESDLKLNQVYLHQQANSQSFSSRYYDFKKIEAQPIAQSARIELKADKTELQALLNYSNMQLNENVTLPFQIPSNFKRRD